MKSLSVTGRRWFQRTYGNTYHTVTIVVDDTTVTSPRQYGYGEQYLQTAKEELEKLGHLKDLGQYENLRQYCERKNIPYAHAVSDVPRQRDL